MKPIDLKAILAAAADGSATDEDLLLDAGIGLRGLLELVELQTRALLTVEWQGHEDYPCCGACGYGIAGHDEGCPIDAALTLAGYPDQASRDAERAEIARRC